MLRKTLATSAILIVMLVSLIGSAAADSVTGATETPVPEATTQPVETTYFTHPIVQVLSAYFGRSTPVVATPEVTETAEPTETATSTEETPEVIATDPTETATPESEMPAPEDGPDIAEQIAAYHDAGMGFGVLVKLYAMEEASQQACAIANSTEVSAEGDGSDAVCTPITVDELVTEFQSGSGMGTLFKEYGKPALLGVGHVKQALKNQSQEQPILEETETTTTMNTMSTTGKAKPQKTPKPKTNNGKGHNK